MACGVNDALVSFLSGVCSELAFLNSVKAFTRLRHSRCIHARCHVQQLKSRPLALICLVQLLETGTCPCKMTTMTMLVPYWACRHRLPPSSSESGPCCGIQKPWPRSWPVQPRNQSVVSTLVNIVFFVGYQDRGSGSWSI